MRESNWLLFPVVVNFVLEALGYACKTAEIEFAYKNYYKFKEHYLESGWYFDGQNDRAVDITTPEVSPTICFGFTSSSPILTGSLLFLFSPRARRPSAATCGRARCALEAVWQYFIAHGCLRNGTLTQGYFDSDPHLVERYMGPGSSHWPTCMRPGASSGRLRTSHFLSRWRITAWSSKSSDG
jgi:hypothetical protein